MLFFQQSGLDQSLENLREYLLYANPSQLQFNASESSLVDQSLKQYNNEKQFEIPERSPNRKKGLVKSMDSKLSSPSTLLEANFDHDSESLLGESIFSAPEPHKHGEFDMDDDELEELFQELDFREKKKLQVVFEIDDVVSIVGTHSPFAFLGVRQRKTLSYVRC